MKKLTLLLLMMCVWLMSYAQSNNDDRVLVDGIYYERAFDYNNEIAYASNVTNDYSNDVLQGDVYIPSQVTINGEVLDVTTIYLAPIVWRLEEGAKIVLPSSVTTVWNCCLDKNKSSHEIEFDHESMLCIDEDGLAYAKLPEELYLPNITCVGPTALYGTPVKKLKLGSNLSTVGYHAFLDSDITEIEFEDGNHESFSNGVCPFLSSKAFVGMKIKELRLPRWENMDISDCVATHCPELERVVFPDVPYITYAYGSTFAYISAIWGFYGYFFMDCPKLKEVVCLGAEPLEIKDLEDFATRRGIHYNDCQTFEFMDNIDQCVLKVPAGSEEKYRNHPVWGKFKTIYGFENGDYTSISGIAAMDGDADGESEYFNLQGVKVTHPTPGNIYIHRNGAKVEKVAM